MICRHLKIFLIDLNVERGRMRWLGDASTLISSDLNFFFFWLDRLPSASRGGLGIWPIRPSVTSSMGTFFFSFFSHV